MIIKATQATLLIFLLLSCSLAQKTAIRPTSSLLYKASEEIETEDNWETFRQALPANLKLLESLLYLDQNNKKLFATIIKGYTAYSFAIFETLYFEDQLKGDESSINKDKAILYYSKAFKYGIDFLKNEGIEYQDLVDASKSDGGIVKLLRSKLEKSDETLDALLFTAQSLISLINLQKKDVSLMAQLPIGAAIYDYVCAEKPEINFGACLIFKGAYLSSRPKLLGGDPDEGKKVFREAIKKYPENWLVRMMLLQFHTLPMLDEEEFQTQMAYLDHARVRHIESMRWKYDSSEPKIDLKTEKRLRFYQALSIKRYEILKANAKDLF